MMPLARSRPGAEFHIRGPLEGGRPAPAAGLAASLALHLLAIALAVGLAHRRAEPVLERAPERMIAVAPMPMLSPPLVEPRPTPPAPPPQAAPPPDAGPVVDDPGLEPEPPREPEPELPDPGAAEDPRPRDLAAAVPLLPPSTPPVAAPSMEAEAQRIFGGPRRRGTGTEAGTEDGRPLPPPLSNGECPYTIPPAVPGEPVRMTTASGRILREGTDTPLVGALLQVIGTAHSTMSGDGGQYTLTIPLELVANCRTQYVRVMASGYRSRLLPLTLGAAPESDDVRLRRR